MAKKELSNLTHYVYFDKRTGQILSIGNEADLTYENGIKISFEEVEPFLDGKWKFTDYLVGYKRNEDGKSELTIVPNTDQGYAFKNNVFEWISETNKDTECIVTWNRPKYRWEFKIDKNVAKSYDILIAPKLIFFVTLENDFDFLIRTIFINLQDLISSENVTIPFESNIESKIDKISISSKLVFKSYGLRIIHDE
jgi:hypothetical protein